MALPLMQLGEIAEVFTDARFAYGTIGLKNEDNPDMTVPPSSNVIELQ